MLINDITLILYDSSTSGRLSPQDLAKVLYHTLAIQKDCAMEIFQQIDTNGWGYITFEKFKSFAEKRAEFASLFSTGKEEKFIPRNGEICSNDFHKKSE